MVNDHLAKGWTLSGNLAVTHIPIAGESEPGKVYLCQAVTIDKHDADSEETKEQKTAHGVDASLLDKI